MYARFIIIFNFNASFDRFVASLLSETQRRSLCRTSTCLLGKSPTGICLVARFRSGGSFAADVIQASFARHGASRRNGEGFAFTCTGAKLLCRTTTYEVSVDPGEAPLRQGT